MTSPLIQTWSFPCLSIRTYRDGQLLHRNATPFGGQVAQNGFCMLGMHRILQELYI